MKRRDYDQTKKVLENWLGELEGQEKQPAYKPDLMFLLESMKDRSFPDEEYLGEEVLNYLTALGEEGTYPAPVVLAEPSDQEERACFEKINQILKVENGSLGKWAGKSKPDIFGEIFLHLAIGKGKEDAFKEYGKFLRAELETPQRERELAQALLANDIVARAAYLAKYEDPDWAFDTHKFLYGEREDKTYSSQTEMWYGMKEEKLGDHDLLFVFEDRETMKKEMKDTFESAAFLGTEADRKEFYEKVLQPLEKECYSSKEKIVDRKNQYSKARDEFSAQLEVVKNLQKELGEFQFKALRMLSDWEAREKTLADAKSTIEHHQKLIKDAETVRDGFANDRKSLDEAMEEMSSAIDEETAKLKDLEKEINESKTKVTEGYAKEEETLKSVSIVTKILSKKKYDAAVELADQYHKEAGDAQDLELKLSKDAKDLGMKLHELLDQQEQMEEKRASFTEEIGKRNKDINSWTQIIGKKEEEIKETEGLLKEVKEEYEKLMETMKKEGEGGNRVILDKPFLRQLFSKDEKEREKARNLIPWVTPKYDAEREKLYSLAIKLCKEFACASHYVRENLITLEQYWGFRMGDDKKKIVFHPMDLATMVPALYQTVFLITPAIALTAEEAGDMMKDMKKPGTFGRMFMETNDKGPRPQQSVGILFRSRQANILSIKKS